MWEKAVARSQPIDLCLHLHFHLQAVSAVAIMFAFAFALGVYGFACVCGFHCVCSCVAFVFTPALHLRLHWRRHGRLLCSRVCTWVALVLECLVPSEFWKETLKNPHLLWHLLAVVCVGRCWFRLRLWFPPAIASLGTASPQVALL